MISPLFLAHGSPMIAIENNEYTQFLRKLGQQMQPKAIIIFTAHWEKNALTISFKDDVYETIYDFGGFPPELYAVKYPAKGSTTVASQFEELLHKQGIQTTRDLTRGLDHGVWTLLNHLYPNADVPVVQVSVNPYLPAAEQFAIGQAIQSLAADDILIIGSGVTVHNLRRIHWGQTTPEPWAVQFDDWLLEKLTDHNYDSLFHYDALAPNASLAVPTKEHFVPLFIALGSGPMHTKAKVIHRSYELGTLSYLCLQFDSVTE